MCIKCEIKKALADAMGIEVKEEVIGKATEAQLKKLQAANEDEKAIKKQIEAEFKAEVAPIRDKYKQRSKELLTPIFERHDAVCGEIHKTLGVTEEDDLAIDMETGEVTKKVIKKKESSNLH
ncbi:hypothetical protein U2I54_16295 [Bacillus pseudomycoides]|uniref:Phage protein n=1 Tax=Bacillus bingmayongensis TaxID=1150157 RepID=A0ABU5JYS9_9BACI|nr:hypothetical protein [Bacillus pseudomycoides]